MHINVGVYMCVRVHTYTCIYTHMYIYIYVYIYIYKSSYPGKQFSSPAILCVLEGGTIWEGGEVKN